MDTGRQLAIERVRNTAADLMRNRFFRTHISDHYPDAAPVSAAADVCRTDTVRSGRQEAGLPTGQ
jgi:hypothetical protein